MKKITSTLFLALVLAISATFTSAQDGGQIPIVGRTTAVAGNKTTASMIDTTTEANTMIDTRLEFSSEISGYLWTFVSIIKLFRF